MASSEFQLRNWGARAGSCCNSAREYSHPRRKFLRAAACQRYDAITRLPSTTSLPKLMNRTHIRPTATGGFAAEGGGCGFGGFIKIFLHQASTKADVAATQ